MDASGSSYVARDLAADPVHAASVAEYLQGLCFPGDAPPDAADVGSAACTCLQVRRAGARGARAAGRGGAGGPRGRRCGSPRGG
jgi:hypothetical protein